MRTTLQNPSLIQSKAYLMKTKKISSINCRKNPKISQLNIPFLNEHKLPKQIYAELETPNTFPNENEKKQKKNLIKSSPTNNFKIFSKMERGIFSSSYFFSIFLFLSI